MFGVERVSGSIANYLAVQGSVSGASPGIYARGPGASISIYVVPKASDLYVAGGLTTTGRISIPSIQAPTGSLAVNSGVTFNGAIVERPTGTPSSSSATCTQGQHAWDASYEYRCVATNTWKRAALAAW